MKQISGNWRLDPSKLNLLIGKQSQPVNFSIGDQQYSYLTIDADNAKILTYADIINNVTDSDICINVKVSDIYAQDFASINLKYGYPVYYGSSSKSTFSSINEFNKLIVDKAIFEISKVHIAKDNYFYLAIPKAYDSGNLLITINDAFGGIELLETEEINVNDYIPVEYNIYRSVNTSLGDLHITVSERSLGSCLFM